MTPAVFLDRDGVINRALVRDGKPFAAASLEQIELLPGVEVALRALKARGYRLVVITNQPDVARGTLQRGQVDEIHANLRSRLGLDAVLCCCHDDGDHCDCRKPKPGLLHQAARQFDIDLSASFMVGDRWKDIEAGSQAACKTFFVDYGYRERRPERCDYVVSSLLDAAEIIAEKDARPIAPFERLNIKIFADGADRSGMLSMYAQPFVRGLTTNPTLMRNAGVANYRDFAREILREIRDKPVSFEVLSDEFAEMERQAMEIASWADNVYVKIPVTNTRGESSAAIVADLAARNVKVNVTAVATLSQVERIVSVLNPAVPSVISVFAGRIADTGVDPAPLMTRALALLKPNRKAELLWASSREMLNIFQADAIGCHIVTVTNDILNKVPLIGYSLSKYSLDTVKMFYNDARSAGYSL